MFQYILIGIMGATLIGGGYALLSKRPAPPPSEEEKALQETIEEEKAQVKELRDTIQTMKEELQRQQNEASPDSLNLQPAPEKTP